MCRGDRREAVFRGDHDNQLFIETLGEACGRCGWVVHAYVLMSNHYHMLLETPEANLVAGMVAGDVHYAFQCSAPGMRAFVPRTLQVIAGIQGR